MNILWIDALISGKYKKASGILNREKFCLSLYTEEESYYLLNKDLELTSDIKRAFRMTLKQYENMYKDLKNHYPACCHYLFTPNKYSL